MFDTQENISMKNSISYVAPKKDCGTYHETKQYDLLCGGNLYLLFQEILEYSFQFDGSKYEPNLQTVLAI